MNLLYNITSGTGGFVVTAMTHAIKQLRSEFTRDIGKDKENWNDYENKVFQDKISDMAKNNYFGFDINPDLEKASKLLLCCKHD